MASEEERTGVTNGGQYDSEDEEDDLSKLRPVDIEQDVREMERRKRVDAIMSSKLFREELERVVCDSLKESDGFSGLLSNMMNVKTKGNNVVVLPINDIRGVEGMVYTKHEKQLRCKLASVYRLVDLYGWSQNIYNHITVRISQDTEHFLLNPFGMLYNEITASSLVKVDMQGNIVETGTTNFGINGAGFILHSCIHAARPDIKAIIHIHTPPIVAISSMKCGLLPLSQEACLLGDVSYHAYKGLLINSSEQDSLIKDLGVHNKIMILHNHGAVCCGETIEEAFLYLFHLILACETQLKMMSYGMENLILIDEETRRRVFEVGQGSGGGGVDRPSAKGVKWNIGEMEFEALMRSLDNSGYRTGYIFKHPLIKEEPHRIKNDVELPPAVSSLGYLLEEENLYKDGPLRALLSHLSKGQKGTGKTKWMNSPNVYQKVEVLEVGSQDPKKITKWISEGSPSHSTPIPIESPNQFVPLGTSKKEFKKIQKAMKEGRRAGGITAGPESKVLDGTTWDEVRPEVNSGALNYEPPMDFKVGAASKGIIQRDFQHHATVFGSAYAKNPFDNVTREELAEYQRIVDCKSRGENPYSPEPPEAIVENLGDVTGEVSLLPSNAFSPVLSPTSDTDFGGDNTYNGEETDGNHTFSEGEADTSRATDPDSLMSPRKDKKKKSGLRTPSFLKKKKKDKKQREKEKV